MSVTRRSLLPMLGLAPLGPVVLKQFESRSGPDVLIEKESEVPVVHSLSHRCSCGSPMRTLWWLDRNGRWIPPKCAWCETPWRNLVGLDELAVKFNGQNLTKG